MVRNVESLFFASFAVLCVAAMVTSKTKGGLESSHSTVKQIKQDKGRKISDSYPKIMVTEKVLTSLKNTNSKAHKAIKEKEVEQGILAKSSLGTSQRESEPIASSIKVKDDSRSTRTAKAQPKIDVVMKPTKVASRKSMKIEKSTSSISTMRKSPNTKDEFEGIKVDTAPSVQRITETDMDDVAPISVHRTVSATKRKLVSSLKTEKTILATTKIQNDPKIATDVKRAANIKGKVQKMRISTNEGSTTRIEDRGSIKNFVRSKTDKKETKSTETKSNQANFMKRVVTNVWNKLKGVKKTESSKKKTSKVSSRVLRTSQKSKNVRTRKSYIGPLNREMTARAAQIPFLSVKSRLHYEYSSKWPVTCPCELASGMLKGKCWRYTGIANKCKLRACRPSYVCVNGAKTPITCMRKTITSRVVHTADDESDTCHTVPASGYFYTPYYSGPNAGV